MKSKVLVKRTRWALQMLFVLSLVATAAPKPMEAQTAPASATQATPAQRRATGTANNPSATQQPVSPSQQLAEASNEAVHRDEGDESAAFKYSSSVQAFSKMIGVDVATGYTIFTVLNFVIIALVMLWIWKKVWPSVVRSRNERISRGLDEARRSSAEAQRRLNDIEARLSRLDGEIAKIRTDAENDSKAEEERMRNASAQEKQRILSAADQEIASASSQARRELKAFTAELAVNLAKARLAGSVDAGTDEQLVREFAQRLGKDGNA